MRVPRLNFLAVAVSVAAGAGLASLICFPPLPLVERVLRSAAGPNISWTRLTSADLRPSIHQLIYPHRDGELRIDQLDLTHPIYRGGLTGAWSFDFRGAEFFPSNSQWPTVRIESGEGRWLPGKKALSLKNCVSPLAKIDADVVWGPDGRVQKLRVEGVADPSELRRFLAVWKKLPIDQDVSDRIPFAVQYERGTLFITVKGKPFFRAAWQTANGAF